MERNGLLKYIYFHIYSINSYKEVIQDLMNACQDSGLLDDVEAVRYTVAGPNNRHVHEIMRTYPKTWCQYEVVEDRSYERLTLHQLHKDCQEWIARSDHDDVYILYFHSKGVSYQLPSDSPIKNWYRTMIHGLSYYRHLCWQELDRGIHAVGSYKRESPAQHFAGNFWWSKASYIVQLSPTIRNRYLDPEMWILSHPHVQWSELVHDGHGYDKCISVATYVSRLKLRTNRP